MFAADRNPSLEFVDPGATESGFRRAPGSRWTHFRPEVVDCPATPDHPRAPRRRGRRDRLSFVHWSAMPAQCRREFAQTVVDFLRRLTA